MAISADDLTLNDNLTLQTDDLTATVPYSLPDDGYVYYSDLHGVYADKIYFGCNDSADNWEMVELTADILNDNPELYRTYSADEEYEEGAHVISDGALVRIGANMGLVTLALADDLTLHDFSELTATDDTSEVE